MADTDRWPELGSAEDAHRTHAWARELVLMWEAEKAALEAQIADPASDAAALRFKDALAPGYIVWHDGKPFSAEDTLTQIKRGLLAALSSPSSGLAKETEDGR